MAIGLLKQTFVKRASGGHVVGKAAYISGRQLRDELQGRTYSAESSGVLLEGLLTPESAPEWANSRQALWNAVEAREKRRDSTLARDLVLALPHELDLKSNQRLLEGFLRDFYVSRGYSVDFAIHAPHRGQEEAQRGDVRNVHAHVLVPLRAFENGQWSRAKDNDIRRQKHGETPYIDLKEAWDKAINQALAEAQIDQRVTCRSYEERGERYRGQVSEGKDATHLQRRTGVETALRTLNETIKRHNDLVAQQQEWGDKAPEIGVGIEAYGELIDLQRGAFREGQSGQDLASLQQEVIEVAKEIERQMAAVRVNRELQEARQQAELKHQQEREQAERERQRQLEERQRQADRELQRYQAKLDRRQQRQRDGVDRTLAGIVSDVAALGPGYRGGFELSAGEKDSSGQRRYVLRVELIIGKEQYSLVDRQQGGKDLLKRGFLGGRDEGAIDAGLEALQLQVIAQAERQRQYRVEQQRREEQERQQRREAQEQKRQAERRRRAELERQRLEEARRLEDLRQLSAAGQLSGPDRQEWEEHVLGLTHAAVAKAFKQSGKQHIYLSSEEGRTHAEYDSQEKRLVVWREGGQEPLLDARWDGESWVADTIESGELVQFARTLNQRVLDRQQSQSRDRGLSL